MADVHREVTELDQARIYENLNCYVGPSPVCWGPMFLRHANILCIMSLDFLTVFVRYPYFYPNVVGTVATRVSSFWHMTNIHCFLGLRCLSIPTFVNV